MVEERCLGFANSEVGQIYIFFFFCIYHDQSSLKSPSTLYCDEPRPLLRNKPEIIDVFETEINVIHVMTPMFPDWRVSCRSSHFVNFFFSFSDFFLNFFFWCLTPEVYPRYRITRHFSANTESLLFVETFPRSRKMSVCVLKTLFVCRQ